MLKVETVYHLEDDPKFYSINNQTLKLFKDNIIVYMTGFIQRKILLKTNCEKCKKFMDINTISSAFIELKDVGGLIRPNKEIVKVVEIIDKVIQIFNITTPDILSERNIYQKVNIKAMSIILEQHPGLLEGLDGHGGPSTPSHKSNIIKQIVAIYTSMKLKHLSKLKNEKKNDLARHKNLKANIFVHQ